MITYDDTYHAKESTTAELFLEEGTYLPLGRFEELIQAEAKLQIVHEAYITQKSWDIERTLALIFPGEIKKSESDGGDDVK